MKKSPLFVQSYPVLRYFTDKMVDDNTSPNFFYAFGAFLLFDADIRDIHQMSLQQQVKIEEEIMEIGRGWLLRVAVYSVGGSSSIYYIDSGDIGGGQCHNGGFDSLGGHHWSGGGHTDSGGGCDSGGGGGDCG